MKNTLKPIALLISICLLITLINYGCKRQDNDIIRIGVILPLTGDLSSYGTNAKLGIDLALQQVENEKIKLYYEDSKGEPRTAVSAFNKLASIDKVDFVIGDLLSSTSLSIAPIANSRQLLTISPTASSSEINSHGIFSISIYPSELMEGKVVSKIALENDYNNVAIIYEIVAAAESMANSFKSEFLNSEGRITLMEGVTSGTRDFRNIISKLRNNEPDAIFLITYPEIASTIIKQLREGRVESKLLGQSALFDEVFFENVYPYADGMILTGSYFSIERSDRLMNHFINIFMEKHNIIPSMFAAQSFDAFFFGLENYKPFKDKKITSLDDIEFRGVTGLTKFDNKNAVIKDFSIFLIDNKDLILLN